MKLLEASGANQTDVQHVASCVRLAKQIAHLEQKVKDEYLTIAKRADDIKPNAEDSSTTTLSLSTAKQKHLLSKIEEFYKQEREALKAIETAEKDLAKSARNDRDTLDQLRQHFEDTLEFFTQNAKLTAHTGETAGKSSKLLQDLISSIEISSLEKVSGNNLRYIQHKMGHTSDQSERDAQKDEYYSKDRDVQKITDLSVGHMIIDPEFSGMTMINGVCMFTREIRSFKCDKTTGITTIVFREDIPNSQYSIKKSIQKEFPLLRSIQRIRHFHLKLQVTTYRRPGDERTTCTIKDGDKETTYDTKSTKKIVVSKHEKHEGDLELSYRVEVKTMPDDTIKHDDKIICYSRESFATCID